MTLRMTKKIKVSSSEVIEKKILMIAMDKTHKEMTQIKVQIQMIVKNKMRR